MTRNDRQGRTPGRKVVLLGEKGTKRTIYLVQAARKIGLPVFFIEWAHLGDLWEGDFQDALIKIDPPVWDSCDLEEMDSLVSGYKEKLEALADLQERQGACFLDHPLAIRDLLDKRACKERLVQAGLPVTEQVAVTGQAAEAGQIAAGQAAAVSQTTGRDAAVGRTVTGQAATVSQTTGWGAAAGQTAAGQAMPSDQEVGGPAAEWIWATDQLLEKMAAKKIFQVFIKPLSGSGAAGTAAFRWDPRTGRMMLYTCALLDTGVLPEHSARSDQNALSGHRAPSWPGVSPDSRTVLPPDFPERPSARLLNTKRLRCFSREEEIRPLLDRLLKTGCIVERWYAKASHGAFSYDLRAVVQGGELDFLLARLSKGPITNLHLNNHPLEASALGLPDGVLGEIRELCRKAVACYPGLWSAGIDILLERGSLKPRIIEMNGQGDLLYQDIYGENRIYGHQAEWMKRQAEIGQKRKGSDRKT